MFFSFAYLALPALLGLLVRSRRGPDIKDTELMVLRHELDRGAGSRLGSIVGRRVGVRRKCREDRRSP